MDKKIALVTGANGGIGRAILKSLMAEDFYILASCRQVEQRTDLDNILGDFGEAIILDIRDNTNIAEVFNTLKQDKKTPSVLVNNAGITQDALIARLDEEKWDSVLETNLKASFMLSKEAVKYMSKNRWGRIINISSVVARLGNKGQANYSAAKAGLEAMTRVFANEYAKKNICVNAIAPGFIQTPMTDKLTAEQKNAMLTTIPMGRFGQAEEVANLVAFLASEKSSYITGQTLQINGGMFML